RRPVPPARRARGARRARLGRPDLRADRPTDRRLGRDGAPPLRRRPRRPARETESPMPESPLDPELTALSAALGRLAPAAAALDRDRLLYEAGRRSARPRPRGWPLTACAFAALSVG